MKLQEFAQLAHDKNISKLIQNGFFSITYKQDSVSLQGDLKNIAIDDITWFRENAEGKATLDGIFHRVIVQKVYFCIFEEAE